MKLLDRIFRRAKPEIKSPVIGRVYHRETANPFESWTVTVTDVQRGYVQYQINGSGPLWSLDFKTFNRLYGEAA